MVCEARSEADQVGQDRRPQVPVHRRHQGVGAAEKLRIQQLWDRLVAQHTWTHTWSQEDLIVASALAEGKNEVLYSAEQLAPKEVVRLQPLRLGTQPAFYASEVARLQRSYPEVIVVPADPEVAEVGRRQLTEGAERTIEFERRYLLTGDHSNQAKPGEPTVAKALDAYEAHVKVKFLIVPETEEGLEGRRLSDCGQSYLKQIGQIRVHNAEQLAWPISRLTYEGCDAMLEVWRQRPLKKDESGMMKVKTCQSHAKLLKRFFRWLSKSDDFDWTKPRDFDELSLGIRPTNLEKAARVTLGRERSRHTQSRRWPFSINMPSRSSGSCCSAG